jgi:hypothetical protein
LPEGHITGEADFDLFNPDCLGVSLVGWVVLICHIDVISELSDDELSESVLTGSRSVCLGCLTSFVGLSIRLSLLVLVLAVFFDLGLEPEGPQTSNTLLNP